MAGYIFTLGSDEYLHLFYNKDKSLRTEQMESSEEKGKIKAKKHALKMCIYNGIYAAKCSKSGAPYIGTLADYLGMKAGDNVYFFMDRTIYGIGKLVDIAELDCRFRIQSKTDHSKVLLDDLVVESHPFVCTFVPEPFFFRKGVDMDEVLMLCSETVKSLRFFSKRSFIKLDDYENEAIKSILARKNEEYLEVFDEQYHYNYSDVVHINMEERIKDNKEAFRLSVFDYIKYSGKHVKSEYYLEGAIMDLLRYSYDSKLIGKWDFIGRQFPASPPKPSEYQESMDLFGFRYVPGFKGAVSKYVVIELKAGVINADNVQQTMKYVDWISKEYTKGDYSLIEAYTIGYDKEDGIEKEIEDITKRNYIIASRQVNNERWDDLKILSYVNLLKELKEKVVRDGEDNE